ncbi:MAG: extracellular solute-binding protein [Treponema sp.]|nr:extracellular solute-binding protein [Treponema sp.]
MKKIIIILLLCSIYFNAFAQNTNQPTYPELRNAEVTVGSFLFEYDVRTQQTRNDGERRILDYRRRVLTNNGFSFKVIKLEDHNYIQQIVRNITSGNKDISIYEVEAGAAIQLLRQGLLYPVSDNRAVNLRNREAVAGITPMYNPFAEELMTFGGKQYGWNYGLPNDGWGQTVLYFNTAHLAEVGLEPEYLYNLQKDNNWTWAAFLDLCKKLRRGSTYALPNDDATLIINAFIFGNGANFVTFDNRGRARNATNTPAFREALQFYNQLINEDLMLTRPRYDWGWHWSAFMNQQVSMVFDPEWRKAQMNQNFTAGYVLPPRGPRVNQFRLDALNFVYVIPNIFSPAEVDIILKAAELWNAPLDTDWLQGHYWASRNVRDVNETTVMSRDMRFVTARNYALIPNFPYDGFIDSFRNGLGSSNPARIIEQWSSRFNAAITEYNR